MIRPRDGPRFQRSNGTWLVSWGVAPGWDKSAPLALNRYRDLSSAGVLVLTGREQIIAMASPKPGRVLPAPDCPWSRGWGHPAGVVGMRAGRFRGCARASRTPPRLFRENPDGVRVGERAPSLPTMGRARQSAARRGLRAADAGFLDCGDWSPLFRGDWSPSDGEAGDVVMGRSRLAPAGARAREAGCASEFDGDKSPAQKR